MNRMFACCVGILWLLSGCSADNSASTAETAQPSKGVLSLEKGTFPEMTLTRLDGTLVNTRDLFAGKVVVFNVWATWCPPCRQEMPDLVALSKALPSDKFIVIGLAADSVLADVQRYVSENGVSFPIFWDKGGAMAAELLQVRAYPETFLLNDKGQVTNKVIGGVPWAAPESISIIQSLYGSDIQDFQQP
ncbi:MAG: TlpA family protein disulfide reductase [Zetaproteobacteria bacterium]|nr:TlpA family protein disulfide reductase [Zetaproteobacteria bacterium]